MNDFFVSYPYLLPAICSYLTLCTVREIVGVYLSVSNKK